MSLPSISSALAPIFRQAGLDIYLNLDLSALFQGFAKSAPPRSPCIPVWDLSLVLNSLTKAPYEHLHLASLWDVALKALFLLALASACQVSKFHVVSAEVRHSRGWSSMTYSLAPDFLAKTQVPGDKSQSKIFIPALVDYVGDSQSYWLLCPARAVQEYLQRTRDCRPRCLRLFVVISELQQMVHLHTISFWICQVIQRTHQDVLEEDMRSVKVKVHDIRVVATSALFKKITRIPAVLWAGTWKRVHFCFILSLGYNS